MRVPRTIWTETARRGVVGLLMGAVLVVGGCGDDETTQPPEEFAPPTNLTYTNGTSEVLLDWDPTPDAARSDFAGYNAYRHTQSLAGIPLSELNTYKLNNVDITVTTFLDVTAVNGTRYFYAVRALKENGDLSEQIQIDTAARREGGEVTLAEFASPDPSGLDLSTGTAYAMSSSDPDNRAFIDVYLGTTSANDSPDQNLALKSPSLVNNSDTDWSGRAAELKLIDTWEQGTTAGPPGNGWGTQVDLGASSGDIVGKVIAIRTPPDALGKRYYAKIRILDFSDTGDRAIELEWAFQDLDDYLRFRAPR